MVTERSSTMSRRDRVRRLGNRVNLSTPFGLAVARLGRAAVQPGPRGLLLAEGYRLPFPVAGAFTVGDVLITAGRWARHRPGLLEHEERHSWQWFWCAGLPFLPAYGACLVWSVLRTGDRAAANLFERRAGLALGGYREVPVRPLVPAVRAAWSGLTRPARPGRG
ncbi:hypothetical protein GCM10009616_03080 [Microlunatus lacustris]